MRWCRVIMRLGVVRFPWCLGCGVSVCYCGVAWRCPMLPLASRYNASCDLVSVAFLCATVVFVALPYVAPGDAL